MLCRFQNLQQLIQIMAVNRAKIFKAQLFKNRAWYHQVLYTAFNTFDSI